MRLATSTRTISDTELLPGALGCHGLRERARVGRFERLLLDLAQFGDAGERGVEHLVEGGAGERRTFAGALDLDEGAGVGGDDVHVDLGAHVLLVGQVETDAAVDDADAHGGDGARDGLRVGEAARSAEPRDGVGERDVGAGDGGGAGAAVGLQDVAVDGDGVLAERGEVDAGAQGAADEAADLLGAPAELAFDGFAAAAGVCGGGEHRVFGGEPAETGTLAPAWYAFFDAGRAHDAGLAEFHEHRARGVVGESSGDPDGAEFVVRSAVFSCGHPDEPIRCGRRPRRTPRGRARNTAPWLRR
ncbi:conserved hypothetical protein [Rhodococcus ruber]|uniref:Uncharacterized protein n=1 Tax=Rhodococcus ruber TaxID=1830 RepID=A0A098BL92_9NOCA|nr:conserved hypothetical protein [Rhodococcus ruber]